MIEKGFKGYLMLCCARLEEVVMDANNTTSSAEGHGMQLEHNEFRITKIIFYVLILLLSCIGNSLVVVVIVGAKDMRIAPNFLILNLAMCDFLTTALSIPFDLALEESQYIWLFGSALCKLLWPIETVFSTSSSLTLALISVERYTTLSRPFARRITNVCVIKLVLTVHALSISLCVPYFLVLEFNEIKKSCDEIWPEQIFRQAYTVVLFLSGYALPLVTMSIAYVLIYCTLRSNLLLLSASLRPRNKSTLSNTSSSTDVVEHNRKEQNIRLAKMFTIVVVIFAISMFPNQVLWLLTDLGNGVDNDSSRYFSVVGRLCTYANSVLNPFIYALKSKEFRAGFAKIGRASIQPLRKISDGTRRMARKYSRASTLDNRRTIPTAGRQYWVSEAPETIPLTTLCSDRTFKQKHQPQKLDGRARECNSESRTTEIPLDIWCPQALASSSFQSFLDEMRESVC